MNRTLYAYLNINHPIVAWEVAIGRIRSICDVNREKFGVSLWYYSLIEKYISNKHMNKVNNEFGLEKCRQLFFPNAVSRLQGVYFFESREIAEIALDRWRMTYKKEYISAVNFSGNNYTEVDSEWITSYLNTHDPVDPDWMHSYWSGETMGEKALTEIIASGIGLVVDNDLRIRAYKKIMSKWPYSTPLLAMCCHAFYLGKMENIGLAKPALLKNNGHINGSFFINLDDLNNRESEVANFFEEGEKKGYKFPLIMPKNEDVFFELPDFSEFDIQLHESKLVKSFNSIHE